MDKLSLEDSLSILIPSEQTAKTKSPVRIPKVIDIKDDEIEEIEDPVEDMYSTFTIESESNSSKNLTPKRFKVEAPKTPKRKILKKTDSVSSESDSESDSERTVYDLLKDYRYTILKYIYDEDTRKILYLICFDPNGQVLFVELNNTVDMPEDDHTVVKICPLKNSNITSSYKNSIREKMNLTLNGVVLFDGIEYCFLKKNSDSEIYEDYYETVEEESQEGKTMPETYVIVNIDDIKQDPLEVLEVTKNGYQIIQQHQLFSNKETLNDIISSVNNLSQSLKNFDTIYKNASTNLTNDWSVLSTFCKTYYEKYSKQTLTDEEKGKFDKVSVNMFLRFQTFNKQIEKIDNMFPIKKMVEEAADQLNETSMRIAEKDKETTGYIFSMEDLDVLI